MAFQDAKAVVRAHHASIGQADASTIGAALAAHTSADWHWRGMHPFYEQHGAAAVADSFWQPFLTAMSSVQRREDIFFAGENGPSHAPGVWVVSMGHLMGLLDKPFLCIPATRKLTMLRYAEFNRVKDGKIVETAMFFDLIHMMHQAGLRPLPPQTAQHLIQPGPRTHDGLLNDAQDKAEGQKTLRLIEKMIGDIAANSNSVENAAPRDATPQDELRRCWTDDMCWWGPDGIGATFTIDRYIEQHQRPFRTQNAEREFFGHKARLAEGNYGGFFGWANLSVLPLGGYLGLPAGPRAEMRVVDIYRREGDKLAENWIFIDILHFLKQQGLDVIARIEATAG
ncbi:nuclear transport factor 2 family protein [Yoonia sp. 208BN28-4]|uniref:nuclear transport factor 2 family protein n=1 Tax=Yoonia sp. 208BN28-4 TaxID=3126505 RepID=UPI0030A849AD